MIIVRLLSAGQTFWFNLFSLKVDVETHLQSVFCLVRLCRLFTNSFCKSTVKSLTFLSCYRSSCGKTTRASSGRGHQSINGEMSDTSYTHTSIQHSNTNTRMVHFRELGGVMGVSFTLVGLSLT